MQRVARFRGRRFHQRFDLRVIDGSATAPVKGGLVHRDRLTVEFDRALDGRRRQRNRAELIRVADEEHVGAERLPEQCRRQAGGVDEMGLVAAGIGGDGPLEPLGRQREISVAGELTR